VGQVAPDCPFRPPSREVFFYENKYIKDFIMKISVVGAGNAGCFTALFFGWYGRDIEDLEVELIYDPKTQPEKVGQATVLDPPGLLWSALGFNWYNNPIHATFKSGILYEGWGKVNDKHFHPFPSDRMAMHYCPWEMQELILKSNLFNVVESDILSTDDVDADYIFDCRGKPKDFSNYLKLRNPTNSSILAKPNWDTTKEFWSRHIATPDGWTFVIPTHEKSPSHDYCVGYCYNNQITKKEQAERNFKELFDIEIKKNINYENYVAKTPVDGRVILNGNRLFFLEPLESSSTQTYIEIAKMSWDYIFNNKDISKDIHEYIKQTQNFVLWHYNFGSKYNTSFWKNAAKMNFNDPQFEQYLEFSNSMSKQDIIPNLYGGLSENTLYGQWSPYSFKNWFDGMTKINN